MLDDLDRRIVELLASNARLSLKELAQRVELSSPSVSDRLHRLEDRGVIRAYTVDIDPYALGYTLQAIVRIKPFPGKLPATQRMIEKIPEFTECYKVTGDDCYIAHVYLQSIGQLDTILDRIVDFAETSTSIVKATPVKRRLPPL
ncbi:Lrp/AsnC family transcriptional regulator [Sphingomonas sp.]|uniref:Lrp/AsnC family transcriptional regulator n=1 Tax=Sphingomonas sp. TaxID=28214 RepID=UPI003D6DA5AF